MLDILKFIFQDFWHFLGTLLLLETVCGGIKGLFLRNITITKDNKEE
jgi:hypothetical protein